MKIFSLKQLKALIKKSGGNKVSKEAVIVFSEALEEIAFEVLLRASQLAAKERKKLIRVKHIRQAEKDVITGEPVEKSEKAEKKK